MFETDYEQIDQWESQLLAKQREINRLHSEQAELISRLEPY